MTPVIRHTLEVFHNNAAFPKKPAAVAKKPLTKREEREVTSSTLGKLRKQYGQARTQEREIRNRKRQFTQDQLGELWLALISKLREHPKVMAAHTLLLYYSCPTR